MSKQTLEDEARELNSALYAILYWDQDNVIPDDLARRGSNALRPQFAPAAVNADLLEACEAHQAFEAHAKDCGECDEWGAGNCKESHRLYSVACDSISEAIAKAKGES